VGKQLKWVCIIQGIYFHLINTNSDILYYNFFYGFLRFLCQNHQQPV